jgi:predicted TIM-barrel fold metal-dependent hydrolase
MTYFDACAFIGRWPGEKLAFHEIEGLLASMQRMKIERALVTHTVAWQNSPAMGNRLLMEAIAPHAELAPCWVITPGLAVDEQGGEGSLCDRMAREGVRAVRLYPRDHVYSLLDRSSARLLSELNRRNYLVILDLDQVFTQSGLYDYNAASLSALDEICQTYTQLSVLVTRVGYRAFHNLFELMRTNPNLYLDLSFLATHQGVETIVERLGADRLVFGTGQPFVDAGGALLRLTEAGIQPEAKRQIASSNLERLLARVKAPAPATLRNVAQPAPVQETGSFIPQDVEITDAHVHMGPYHKFFVPQNTADDMLRVMDRLSISRSCVSSHMAITGDWALGNRLTAQAVKDHPDRFVGQVVVSPNEPELIEDELKRAFEEWGFRGIKLVPDTHLQPIGSEGYRPVFEYAQKHHRFVLVHTYHSSHYDDPQLFGALAERYPDVPIMMVHSGAMPAGFPGAIRLAQQHSNLYLDISGSFITGAWIHRMVKEAGAERVIYSSDQPFIDPRYSLGRLVFAGLSKDELSLVIGGNIRRLLGLSATQ